MSTAQDGDFIGRIVAATAQVSPTGRRGEALDLPAGKSAQRVDGAGGAAARAEIEIAKLTGIDPQAWPTEVLGRIPDHEATRIDELLSRHYAAGAA